MSTKAIKHMRVTHHHGAPADRERALKSPEERKRLLVICVAISAIAIIGAWAILMRDELFNPTRWNPKIIIEHMFPSTPQEATPAKPTDTSTATEADALLSNLRSQIESSVK